MPLFALCSPPPFAQACEHGLCRTNRTTAENVARPMQGRPLGFLIAWLWAADSDRVHDFDSHQFLSRAGGRGDPLVSLEVRCRARAWLAAQPGSEFLFEAERDLNDGEGLEPLRL